VLTPQSRRRHCCGRVSTSEAPPIDGSLAVVQTKWLFNITGTMAAPVEDVSLIGLGLRDTAYTYMDPHGIPSGGDWYVSVQFVSVVPAGYSPIVLWRAPQSLYETSVILLSLFYRISSSQCCIPSLHPPSSHPDRAHTHLVFSCALHGPSACHIREQDPGTQCGCVP